MHQSKIGRPNRPEHCNPLRRVSARPSHTTGTARRVDIMSGSAARGRWGGTPLPRRRSIRVLQAGPQRACSATISSDSCWPSRTLTSPSTRGAAGRPRARADAARAHRRRAPGRRDRFALNRSSGWGWWVAGGMRGESLEADVDMARRVRSSASRSAIVTLPREPGRTYPGVTLSSQLPLDQRAALGTTDLLASRWRPCLDRSTSARS